MLFHRLKHYLPRSLYGRAALILLLPVVVLQLVVSVVFIQSHLADVTFQMTRNVERELELVARTVGQAATRDEAEAQLAPFLDAFQMRLDWIEAVPEGDRIGMFDLSGRTVRDTLHQALDTVGAVGFEGNLAVHVAFRSGLGPYEVSFNRRRVSAAAPHQLIVTMVFFGILMTLISFLYMRNQLRPITRLATAAQAFGRGVVVPYSPSGATEVRAAGGAFLDMRARIERHFEQRTLLLSGVSHDLRTPLTRMKLSLSLMEGDEVEDLRRDVEEMQHLVDGFLDFSKGASEGVTEAVDVQALIAQVVQDARRAGHWVDIVGSEGEGEIMLRPSSIRRAVENLIGNAVRYGTRAEVSVVITDKSLRIRVEDDGPGIPENQREDALKPFSRLDPARNQNKGGGVGLGLAIVNDVARAHGGVLRLGRSDRLGGLRADIVIGR
jgi:two-component system osmolarity sensor histidine kinase EnvZ